MIGELERIEHGGALQIPAGYRAPTVRHYLQYAEGIVNETTIRAWIADLQSGKIVSPRTGRPYRSATVARYVADLKSALREQTDSAAFRSKLDSLFSGRAPKLDRTVAPRKLLSREECETLKRSNDRYFVTVFEFLLATGLRVSEALSIDRRDMVPAPTSPGGTVDYHVVNVVGKGNKQRRVIIPGESIPREALEQSQADPSLLARPDGTPPDRRDLWRRFARQGRRCIGRPIHPHMARHTFATRLLEAGHTAAAVAAVLGHARVETTSSIYDQSRLDPGTLLASLRDTGLS